MNISETKLELTKKLLNTKDKDLINHIKAVFETQPEDWWDSLPEDVKNSVERGLKQAEKGKGTPHEEVMKRMIS